MKDDKPDGLVILICHKKWLELSIGSVKRYPMISNEDIYAPCDFKHFERTSLKLKGEVINLDIIIAVV